MSATLGLDACQDHHRRTLRSELIRRYAQSSRARPAQAWLEVDHRLQSLPECVSLAGMDQSKSLHDHLVRLGRKGGKARAVALTPERRLSISLKAAAVRWAGHIAKRPSKLPKS